jgi:N-acetyl-alpha-D-muramate 1-phosphate uridylyltransferase
MHKIDTAMILAAGMGNRMRPLTDDRPKPLIDVAGKPLIAYALEQAEKAGLARVILNVHYRAAQVEEFAQNYSGPLELIISDERDLLRETGGGVCHALPLIDREAVVILNADNIWIDGAVPTLTEVVQAWRPQDMDVLLMLTPTQDATGYDGVGDFYLSDHSIPARRGARGAAPYIYSGIHILKTELFAGLKPEPFSLTQVWQIAAEKNRLRAVVHSGKWLHVGTPDGVDLAARALA